MKRRLLILLIFLLLVPLSVCAETAWTELPTELRAGKLLRFAFVCEGDHASVAVLDAYGQTVLTLPDVAAEDGRGVFAWDGAGVAPGDYVLRLTCEGMMAQRQITIGPEAPSILLLSADERLDDTWQASLSVNMPGTVTVSLADGTEIMRTAVKAGETTIGWTGTPLGQGTHELIFRLIDGTGYSSAPESIEVAVSTTQLATDLYYQTPDELSGVDCGHDPCYWRLNMGEMNETAIWRVLTAPVTVLDGEERHQCKVRREPSEQCTDYVGEVTYASQAVHVLERGDEWTLIEAYSSSVEGSSVGVWAAQFQGYVKTSLLKEVPVSQNVGIVVDKLQQRLYVFVDGSLYATLLCSTGFARADTPFNETPAGEFLAISWTGGFWSGSLYCDMAIRINDGILLHEVPCLVNEQADGSKQRDYTRCERYLGEKASHGCIRIQRATGAHYVNAKWLWDNLPRTGAKCKVIIWDDVGRTLGYPADDLPLYYNPKGGKYYHADARCTGVKEKYWPLAAFTYGELDASPYKKLTRCPNCAPQLRHDEIDTLNSKNTR